MTDRELLELAAKAAGITIDPIDAAHDPDDWVCWNPLTDDGDALRLAVKLQLTVSNEHVTAGCAYCTGPEGEEFPEVRSGGNADDHVIDEDYAATRRAIVLAAAEIGQAMSEEKAHDA